MPVSRSTPRVYSALWTAQCTWHKISSMVHMCTNPTTNVKQSKYGTRLESWCFCAGSALPGTESCMLASEMPRSAVDAEALQKLRTSCPAEVGALQLLDVRSPRSSVFGSISRFAFFCLLLLCFRVMVTRTPHCLQCENASSHRERAL